MQRAVTIACLVVVIASGLVARLQRASADPTTIGGFVATYLGDTLWPVMFFLIGRLCFPNAHRGKLLSGTLLLTLSIEFSQLWKPPTLEWLRTLPAIGFALGNSFIWSDVVCIIVGSAVALLLDVVIRRFAAVEEGL